MTSITSWQPEATIEALKARASLYDDIRAFFKERGVLEVETPLLCHAAIQDPHLHPIPAQYLPFGAETPTTLYLQTSPEFAMKRLLAAKVGSMYQLCKAFRNGEVGKIHNPEFSMLEWYRPGYDHIQLMDEVDSFFERMIQAPKAHRISYQDLFLEYLDLDPFLATLMELQTSAQKIGVDLVTEFSANNLASDDRNNIYIDDSPQQNKTTALTRDDWLNLLMTHGIEPKLGFDKPVMVFDFPASQAALAKIRKGLPNNSSGKFDVAERFEVYIQGMELANGYHELTDGSLQEQRLFDDAAIRKTLKHPEIPIDMHLVNALKAGMPACAGIALGVDRLLMLKLHVKNINEVLAFTIDRA